jgi:DNA repair exonuclease SbcCD ATPase subunit
MCLSVLSLLICPLSLYLQDQECIEALGDSLSNWGGKDGSVVVVSHDRAFCEQVGFTHVGTVKDGKLVVEERGLQERDWERYDISSTPLVNGLNAASASGEAVIELTEEEKAEQDRKRKLAFNAPKRIKKIEELIERSEAKIVEYDDKMMSVGNDVEKLMELTDKKTKEEETVASLMEEWEELEEVIAEMSNL